MKNYPKSYSSYIETKTDFYLERLTKNNKWIKIPLYVTWYWKNKTAARNALINFFRYPKHWGEKNLGRSTKFRLIKRVSTIVEEPIELFTKNDFLIKEKENKK